MYKIVITTLLSLFFSFPAFSMKVFDTEEIRDPSSAVENKVTLVKDGKANATIVIAADPSPPGGSCLY